MSDTTFLFHTMLAETGRSMLVDMSIPKERTTVWLTDLEGNNGPAVEFHWPVGGLDELGEDCKPMVDAVLATLERHSQSERLAGMRCFMGPRRAADAMSDAGWLEWGCLLAYTSGATMYIAHIQRAAGAQVERHS